MLKLMRRLIRIRHRWEYRNPADRTCSVCGRHEIQYCADWRDVFDITKGWWEAHRDGDSSKHQ